METEKAIERVKELIEFDENLVGWQCNKNGEVCRKIHLETILKELEKKDKIIDLMVEKYNDDFGDIGDFCQHEYCSKDYNCKECIKQYFENKANEEAE